MPKAPTISVIMSVLNGEDFLKEAVDSILNQTFNDFEFIIINDGSTDRTPEILEEYRDERIVLIHQENIGLTKSLNKAVSLSKGKYIARQDADDISAVARFQNQIEYLESHPECVAVGTWANVIDAEGKEINTFRYPERFCEIKEALKSYNPIVHGSALVRREALVAVGCYNEKFVYTQDYDLWLRLSEIGELGNLPLELYNHRHFPDCISLKENGIQSLFFDLAKCDSDLRTNEKVACSGGALNVQSPRAARSSDRIKVLFISHSALIAGAETCLLTLLKYLNKDLFDPVVILPSEGPLRNSFQEFGIKTYVSGLEWCVRVPEAHNYSNSSISKRVSDLLIIFDIEKPDIIHTNTSVICEGALAAKIKGIPHIWHLHEKLQGHPSLVSVLPLPLLYEMIGSLSDRVVAVSNGVKTQVVKYFPSRIVDVIYNGIDTSSFEFSSKSSIREELSISNDEVIAVTVGSIIKEKGYDNLLAAAFFVQKSNPKIKFVVAGGGDPKTVLAYKEKTRRLGLNHTVFFLGFRKDIPQLLAASDFIILPSLTEAFPLVILESMAAHKPVIATDCGGPAEIILDGTTGFLVQVNDPRAMADRILTLAANPHEIVTMGENGFRRFSENYTAEVFVKKFENLYQSLATITSSPLSHSDLSSISAYLEAYQNQIELRRSEIACNIKISENQVELTRCENQISELQQRLAEINQQLVKQEDNHLSEIRALLNSYSWKITSPLRKSLSAVVWFRSVLSAVFTSREKMAKIKAFYSHCRLYGVRDALGAGCRALHNEASSTAVETIPFSSPILPLEPDATVLVQEISVSVVIPTKDAGDSFAHFLSIIKSQRGIREIQIVVVDSGSTDQTVQLARECGAKVVEILPQAFSHSYARNLGAENASGDFLLFTVQDAMFPTETFLYEMYNVYKNNELAAVSCAEYPREDADLFYRCCCWNHYEFLEVNAGDRIFAKPKEENFVTLRKNGQLSDIANFIPRDLFMKYGYRDDYAEDLDLGIRLIRDDYRIAFLSSVKIIHSHNRPAFYYLKRGHVDQIFLTKKFVDYPVIPLDLTKISQDILFTYAVLVELATEDWSHFLPCGTEKIIAKIRGHLDSALRHPQFPERVTGGLYVDSQFEDFIEAVRQRCFTDDQYDPKYRCQILKGVIDFFGTISNYLLRSAESVDQPLAEEIKFCLFKVFALLCGVNLANCLIRLPDPTRVYLNNVGIDLRAGV